MTIESTKNPTSKTKGSVGDIYFNTETNDRFKCIMAYEPGKEQDNYYYWVKNNSNSGSSISQDEIDKIVKQYVDKNTVSTSHNVETKIDKIIKDGVYTFDSSYLYSVNGLDNFIPESLTVVSDGYTNDNGTFLPNKVTQILTGHYNSHANKQHMYMRTCYRENTAEVNWYNWTELTQTTMYVNVTREEKDDTITYKSDKTFDEIMAAISANKSVIAIYDDYYFYPTICSDDGIWFNRYEIDNDDNGLDNTCISIMKTNGKTSVYYSIRHEGKASRIVCDVSLDGSMNFNYPDRVYYEKLMNSLDADAVADISLCVNRINSSGG